MNSRKNDFLVAANHQLSHFRDCRFRFNASAAPANRRNNTERTIRVTAVLDLNDGARASTGTDVRCGSEFTLQKDAAAQDFRAAVRAELVLEKIQSKSANQEFVRISHNEADLRKDCQLFRRALRVAAGDDDLRARIAGSDPSDRLANVAVCLGGN